MPSMPVTSAPRRSQRRHKTLDWTRPPTSRLENPPVAGSATLVCARIVEPAVLLRRKGPRAVAPPPASHPEAPSPFFHYNSTFDAQATIRRHARQDLEPH